MSMRNGVGAAMIVVILLSAGGPRARARPVDRRRGTWATAISGKIGADANDSDLLGRHARALRRGLHRRPRRGELLDRAAVPARHHLGGHDRGRHVARDALDRSEARESPWYR